MKNFYPIYRDVSDWAILDEKVIHDFTLTERPITIVLVLIGTLHYEEKDFNGMIAQKRTPIMRWMTKKEFRSFNE